MDRAEKQVTAALRAMVTSDAPAAPPAAWLGLRSVPERIARLSPGMIYSLACDQQAVRLPLAAGALAASLRTGKNCVLVTPGDPAMFLRKSMLAGFDLAAHARNGGLALLQLAAEADKHMFRAGPEAFLRELELNTAPGSMIVLDQADAVFMLSDPRESAEAAQAYVRWAEQRDHTLLALFAPSSITPREYLALRRVAENLAGFAVARSSWDGGTLEVRHWFGPNGASPRETFSLRLHSGGVASSASLRAGQDELPPVDTVVCMGEAMRRPEGRGRDWQDVPSHAEALHALQRCETATLVLPFRQAADFAAMCLTISAVRAMGRPELRVAVRECGKRLRAGQALALLRLGISCVIPLDMADLGARRVLEHLKGTRFARACEHDLEQVLDETACALRGQIDSAALFCEAVEGLLAAADGFDFETALVRLTAGRERASALFRACKAGRDLICVTKGEEAWLFLFGCPQTAVGALMQRLIGADCSWSAEFQPERILSELETLRGA
ncbi:MAG TPA: BcsE family c-di-GMP-binding protein [Burkholderiales bacterium]|nr:BcsE family c-di-GMP-binding protein [Burkholderiales bacterium]